MEKDLYQNTKKMRRQTPTTKDGGTKTEETASSL